MYDALYGTDVIPGEKGGSFSQERANKVISYVRKFLNQVFPLNSGSWEEVTKIQIDGDELVLTTNEKKNNLKDKKKFVGFNGEKTKPNSILLKNNNLHIDIIIDPNSTTGKNDKANISDFIIESLQLS